MKVEIKYLLIMSIILFTFECNNNKSNFSLDIKKKSNRTAVLYLKKNSNKIIDSIEIKGFYGNSHIKRQTPNIWLFSFAFGGGSNCSIYQQVLFSVKDNKLKQNLNIELYYEEGVLGDTTFKKNFIRKTDLIKNKNQLYLKRTCLKNDVEFYSITEKLTYDLDKQIYYNKMFSYDDKKYNGVKIDSSEYIYYKNKWCDFNSKEKKIYSEL